MFTRFFIDRPIFASVLSIVITLAGGLALVSLPIAMFPQIAPPTVMVTCQYPGASAQVVAETIAAPIEQQVNGVENMMYMSSASTNDGNYTLTVTFKHGIDLNLAQVLVQNRVSLAVPLLPDVIKATGVTTKKRSPDILLAIGIYSPNGRYDQLYLSNYAYMRIRDEMARLPGISDVLMFGQRDYSMRIWLDPDRLAQRNMTAGDVVRALREQNLQVAAGQVGQAPVRQGQQTQITLSTLGRLIDADEFDKIIVKTLDGRMVKIRDVGYAILGAKNEDMSAEVNGQPMANLAIFQLPDANALDTADLVRAKIDELKKDFPEDLDYMIRYDTTPFIRESIQEVFKTLIDSVVLVALVVLLFLQNWRSALIPLIAVPVGIIGTFAVMAAFGFSLNNLTLFGLVLAIGIVVDDAIVVVESVEHHIEHGMTPRNATIQAMSEVSAPVIAVGLVLSAVFIPCAFISGITGQFFRQFALTIASATVLSTINSLTLSPALSALLLRPRKKGDYQALPRVAFLMLGAWAGFVWLGPHFIPYLKSYGSAGKVSAAGFMPDVAWNLVSDPTMAGGLAGALIGGAIGWIASRRLNNALGWFFDLFNRGFMATATFYSRLIGGMLRVFVLVFLVYVGLLFVTYNKFLNTPRGFIPSQDMGYLLVNVQLPDSASLERTQRVIRQMSQLALRTDPITGEKDNPGIDATVGIAGQSLLLNAYGSNFGTMFVTLEEFKKRTSPDRYYEAIMKKLKAQLDEAIPEATIAIFGPPPVRGVGRAGGWMLMIEDRGDLGSEALQKQVENLVAQGNIGIDFDGTPIRPKSAAKPEAGKPADKKAEPAKPSGLASQIESLKKAVLQQPEEGKEQRSAVMGLASVFRANVPQIFLEVDRAACMTKGVELHDVFETLQAYLGSLYVNDFNRFGRTWQVIVQAIHKYRDQKDDISRLQVRNDRGTMVPLGAVATAREKNGPLVLTRYNMYPAASINGNAFQGVSSGTAINAMEGMANRELPQAMSFEWTEMAYLELLAGNTAVYVFGFSIVMVFLVLAAQFESWAMPLAVILSVPLCMLSALIGVTNARSLGANYTSLDINIFTQIGLVVLVGLASKNSILIVQFAKLIHNRGEPIRRATLEACRLRLRPIIMTSMAFVLGVVPLLYSHGAGAEMRQSLGVAVFSGMLGVTFFGVLLTPVFFYVIDTVAESHFFSSPLVRKISAIVLGILTLSYLWRPSRWKTLRSARKSDRLAPPPEIQEYELVQKK